MKGHEPAMKIPNLTMVSPEREKKDQVVIVLDSYSPTTLTIYYGRNKVEGLGGSDGESHRANAAAKQHRA
jgi:hypothetical protein